MQTKVAIRDVILAMTASNISTPSRGIFKEVEMEAAELYNLAHRHGRRALAVLTVSDHLITKEALPSASG